MTYLKSSRPKVSSSNSSVSEDLSSGRGLSARAVPAVQLQGDEEELQMKKVPAQLVEEEEPLQGKFTAQLAAEEEEEMQMKKDPAQLASEEEEPLQGKFTAQLAEEEEEVQMKKDPAQLEEEEEEEPLQGKFTAQLAEEEEEVQMKKDPAQLAEEEEPLQAKAVTSQLNTNTAQLQEDGADSNKTGMPDHLKAGVESLSGLAMDDVKVHYNSDKPKQLQAHAYAQGTDIHIAPGQEKHLPHEAWHIAQQKQGRVQATVQKKGNIPVNDDKGLENEADVMGAQALSVGLNLQASASQLKKEEVKGGTAQLKVAQKAETEEEAYQRQNAPIIGLISNAGVVLSKVPWHNLGAEKDNVGTGAAVTGLAGSLTGAAGSAAHAIQKTDKPNISKAAGDITSGIGSTIGSLVKSVMAIKEAYGAAKGKEGVLMGAGNVAIALMEALKSGAEAAMSIQKFVTGSVPSGIVSLVPGLGLAIAACEVIKNAYTGYNSFRAEAEMSGVSAEFKAELAGLLGGNPEEAAPTLFASEKRGKFGNRVTYTRLKPGLHESIASITDKGITSEQRTQREANFKKAHGLPADVNIQQLAIAIRSYEVGSKMQEINQKRKVYGFRNIFTNLISMAGEIAKFFPADGGITAGVLLGSSAAIGAAQSAGKFIQTMARNHDVLGGDKNRSADSKHKEYVNHTKAIYEMLNNIPQPVTKASDPKVARGRQLIASTGANMATVFKTDYGDDASVKNQATYLVESMKGGR